jgi:uncharacterized tellurite resistance protein B-like protein
MSMESNSVQALGTDKLEALVEVMFLAAAADGEFSDVERQEFSKTLASLTDHRLAPERIAELLADAAKSLEAEGRGARLTRIKDRLPDLATRKVALSLAIQITAADSFIRTSERELIMETAEALEIPSDVAADLVRQMHP